MNLQKGVQGFIKTHGLHKTGAYRAWCHIKGRCQNRSDKRWPYYGGRGIKVCDRWANSFEAFYEDMGDRPAGMTIERIHNDRDYEPGNCRWATMREQSNNRRTNRLLEFAGRTQTIAQWARERGISRKTLTSRVNHGWDISRALGSE